MRAHEQGVKAVGDAVLVVVEATASVGGVAFAGGELLQGTHGDALVGNLMVFTPCGEVGQKTPVGMGGIHAKVAADFFEVHGLDSAADVVHLLQTTQFYRGLQIRGSQSHSP